MGVYKGSKKIAGLYRAEDISHATEEHAGIIEIADETETEQGTNDTKAITPLKLKQTMDSRLAGKQKVFVITEDIVTVTLDEKKGVSPYSTSYKMTYIEIDKDAGVEWVEGALYSFVVDTKMVVTSAYRNVAIRIGGDEDGDVWHPLFTTSSIASGSTYLIKAYNTTWQYKTVYRSEGALHVQTDTDTNTTYPYLVNTVLSDTTDSPYTIDDNGYGARYSLAFATTPLSDENGIVVDERISSLMESSSTGTTKKSSNASKRKILY